MDTTVGHEQLVLSLALDRVLIVREQKLVVITGNPHARAAEPKGTTATIPQMRH